jgi:hypothetical protein
LTQTLTSGSESVAVESQVNPYCCESFHWYATHDASASHAASICASVPTVGEP